MFKFLRKLKFIVIITIIVYVILHLKKLKTDMITMIKNEFKIGDKFFKTKIKDKQEDSDIEPIKTSKKGRVGPRRKNCKTSRWKREEICRKILEDHFDDYFPSVRPNFLRNPKTGKPLELDGYNANLNLAFEYNGKQHRLFPNAYHKTEEEFNDQIDRDIFKKKRCKQLGIKLISIPDTIPTKNLRAYILSKAV